MTSRHRLAHLTEIDELGSRSPEHSQRRPPRRFVAYTESLLGEQRAVVGQVLHALELEDRFREYARTDSELDSLRDDPDAAASVGGVS